MNRVAIVLCSAVLAGILLWFYPLFHIVRLDVPDSANVTSELNTKEFVSTFWEQKIAPSLATAPEAKELIFALRNNPQTALKQYGRKMGVSRTTLFLMQGKGTVVSSDNKGVGLALEDASEQPDILLRTSLLFGNTVRDATGLLDANQFQDSRQFNEVSAELNQLVEMRVISTLKQNAVKGQRIHFAGCVEIADQEKFEFPLSIIPLQFRIE